MPNERRDLRLKIRELGLGRLYREWRRAGRPGALDGGANPRGIDLVRRRDEVHGGGNLPAELVRPAKRVVRRSHETRPVVVHALSLIRVHQIRVNVHIAVGVRVAGGVARR